MSSEVKDNLTQVKPLPHKQVSVTLQLDADVLEWFKSQGDERNHINKTLRAYMEIRTKQQLNLTDIRNIKKMLSAKQFP